MIAVRPFNKAIYANQNIGDTAYGSRPSPGRRGSLLKRFAQQKSRRRRRLSLHSLTRSVGGFHRGGFRLRDGVLDRALHLLEGAHLDLPDAFAGDAELA